MINASNYFELFGLPKEYQVDKQDLTERHVQLLKALHPDKHTQAAQSIQRLVLQYTAEVNKAYQVLSCPLARAEYWLSLDGISLDAESDTQMSPEFLMEQMTFQENMMVATTPKAIKACQEDWAMACQSRHQKFCYQLELSEKCPVQMKSCVREWRFLKQLEKRLTEKAENI